MAPFRRTGTAIGGTTVEVGIVAETVGLEAIDADAEDAEPAELVAVFGVIVLKGFTARHW